MNPQEREAEAQLRAEAEGRAPSQATSPEPPGFQFAGDQGTAGMERVSEEEFNRFNKEYQNKGFFGKVGDVAVGQGSQTVRAAEDVVGAIFNAPSRMAAEIFGAERVTPLPSQNTGQEFTGELNLPAEFTTPEEFEQMAVDGASPAATQEAADRNFAITEDYVRRGRNVSRDMDIGAFTRQGAALATSDEERRNAIAMEQRAVKTAQEFLDPATQAESELGQLAMEDPRAATLKYLEMRATLENTNPTLANETDRAMLPVVKMSEEQFQAETASLDPESRDGKKALASLSNLQRSRDAIAKGQPSINEQSNIKPAGVKVGDAERVTDVVDTIFDPDRVVPTQNTGSAINTAATVAGRISPSKRINAAQTDALATLAQAGWIDKTTAMSVMMTGHWPPGKNPNGIRKIQEAGGTVYAMTNNDDVIVLQSAKGALPPPAPSTAITDEQVGWVAASIKRQFPNMEDNNVQALTSIMYENPEWVRSRWNNTSQEDMRKLGTFIAETKVLTDNKYTQMADGWFWFEGNTKEAPTVNQTLMDVAMRDRLNVEFGMDYKPMPDLKEMSGLDAEQARQNLEQGRSGREAQINARQYSDDEAIEAYARGVYTELDQAGRLELVNGEWVVLPESEAP
jgi:hypothetical protein